MQKLIWVAFLAAPLIYFATLFKLFGQAPMSGAPTLLSDDAQFMKRAQVELIFAGLGVLCFVLGLALTKASKAFNFWVVRLALFEAIAGIGFMSAYMAKDISKYYIFFGLSMLGLALSKPQRN